MTLGVVVLTTARGHLKGTEDLHKLVPCITLVSEMDVPALHSLADLASKVDKIDDCL